MSTLDGIPGSPVTKAGYAYQTLRRRILEGELQPGERLLLRPMAAELGLSVMPVRDAIRMLEGDGLVRTESHRGTSVAPIDPETVVELIGIRMWLEVLAVLEAAPPHTPRASRSSTSGWRRPNESSTATHFVRACEPRAACRNERARRA